MPQMKATVPFQHLCMSELVFLRTVQMNQLGFCCFTINRKAFTIERTVCPFCSQYTTHFSPLPWNCFFLQTLDFWELSINWKRQITNNLKLASAVLVGFIQKSKSCKNLYLSNGTKCHYIRKHTHNIHMKAHALQKSTFQHPNSQIIPPDIFPSLLAKRGDLTLRSCGLIQYCRYHAFL